MNRYLEEITKVSTDADALELAASASISIPPNRYTEKLYQAMKWGLSVQPSSIASAGQVLFFVLFPIIGRFSERPNSSRHSPRILYDSLLYRPWFPVRSICGSTLSTFDWTHQFIPSRTISSLWRVWSRIRSIGTMTESSSTVRVSVLGILRMFFRTFHAHRIRTSDQSSFGPRKTGFEAECDGGTVWILADAGTEVRCIDPKSLRCSREVYV